MRYHEPSEFLPRHVFDHEHEQEIVRLIIFESCTGWRFDGLLFREEKGLIGRTVQFSFS